MPRTIVLIKPLYKELGSCLFSMVAIVTNIQKYILVKFKKILNDSDYRFADFRIHRAMTAIFIADAKLVTHTSPNLKFF